MVRPKPKLRRLTFAIQVAGLCAMAWFVWVNSIDPRLRHESLGSVLEEALGWVLLAWTASAVITFCIFAIVPGEPRSGRHAFALLASSVSGVWFAPAIIMLSTRSPAGLTIGFALIVNTTRLLVSDWIPLRARPIAPVTSSEIDTAFLRWSSVPSLLAAASVQAGLVSLLWRRPFGAAACFALAAAILVAHSIIRDAYRPGRPPSLPQSVFGTILTALLALSISAGGLQVHRTAGSAEAGRGDSGRGSRVTTLYSPSTATANLGDDGFPGVILRPPERPRVALTVPIRPELRNPHKAITAPVSIPFTGEYWMFQAPWTHPPAGSIVERGTPREVSFRTTNGRPLQMIAEQKLDPPLELACCSEIQVVLSYGEPDPSATLELILGDGPKIESLGLKPAGTAVMNFPIRGPLRACDEIKVIYHRGAPSIRSAKVAIEQFVLAP